MVDSNIKGSSEKGPGNDPNVSNEAFKEVYKLTQTPPPPGAGYGPSVDELSDDGKNDLKRPLPPGVTEQQIDKFTNDLKDHKWHQSNLDWTEMYNTVKKNSPKENLPHQFNDLLWDIGLLEIQKGMQDKSGVPLKTDGKSQLVLSPLSIFDPNADPAEVAISGITSKDSLPPLPGQNPNDPEYGYLVSFSDGSLPELGSLIERDGITLDKIDGILPKTHLNAVPIPFPEFPQPIEPGATIIPQYPSSFTDPYDPNIRTPDESGPLNLGVLGNHVHIDPDPLSDTIYFNGSVEF